MIRRSRGSELEQEPSFGGIRQLFEPTLHGMYWLAARISALLAFDDVHWIDAPSLRALNYPRQA